MRYRAEDSIIKYKVGDKVRILPSEVLKSNHDVDGGGIMARDWGGKVMTIKEVRKGYRLHYKMIEDQPTFGGDGWNWFDSMIAGLEKEVKVSATDLMDFLTP